MWASCAPSLAWERTRSVEREPDARVDRDWSFRPETGELPALDLDRQRRIAMVPEQEVGDERPKRPTRLAGQPDMLDAQRPTRCAIPDHSPERVLPAVAPEQQTDLRCVRTHDRLDRFLIGREQLGLVDEQLLAAGLREIGGPVAIERQQPVA